MASKKSFYYYFAVDKSDYAQFAEYFQGQDILVSFAFLNERSDKKGNLLTSIKKHRGRVMLDSGGFTNFSTPGTVHFEEWLDFMKSEKSWADEYVQFDDLASRRKTLDYYERAKKGGVDPLFVDHLWMKTEKEKVHKIWVDRDKLALSGFAKTLPMRGQRKFPGDPLEAVKVAFAKGREVKTLTHMLAVGSLRRFLNDFDRIDSVDSTAWHKAAAFGKVLVYEPKEIEDYGPIPFLKGYDRPDVYEVRTPMPPKVRSVHWRSVLDQYKIDKSGMGFKTKVVTIHHIKKYIAAMKKFNVDSYQKFIARPEGKKKVEKALVDFGGFTYWDNPEPMFSLEKQEPGAASEAMLHDAEEAKRDNRLTVGKFFFQPKPTRAAAPEQEQSVERFIGYFNANPDWLPAFVQKKFDGARHQIHRDGDRVLIFSEDGTDNTPRFPTVVKEVLSLREPKLILDAEVEMWKGRQHLPREAVAGYINGQTEPDDGAVVVNVFDVLYAGEDLHGEPFEDRLSVLAGLGIKQKTTGVPDTGGKLNAVPGEEVETPDELEHAVRQMRTLPGSEGVVTKRSDSVYPLDMSTPDTWIKFHNATLVRGVVYRKDRTGSGAWVYGWGVRPGAKAPEATVRAGEHEVLPVGDSMATRLEFKEGDGILIEAETVNLVNGPEGQEMSAWVPRVMGPWDGEPDTVDSAASRARENLVLQEKEINADGEIEYKQATTTEKQEDPYLEIPPEGGSYPYVVHHHHRGRSLHSDFRVTLRPRRLLIGWTLNTMIEGSIPEPVTTLAEAKEVVRRIDQVSKINWKTGEWAERPRRGSEALVRTEILSERKAPEPYEWINVEGVTPAGQEGERPPVGATVNFPGVFLIVDQGTVEFGAQKPWVHEYFVHGAAMNYRLIFRQLNIQRAEKGEVWNLPPEGANARASAASQSKTILPPSQEPKDQPGEGANWFGIYPNDLTPYVLGRDAVASSWMPPLGYSALPAKVRLQVPTAFQYWKAGTAGGAKAQRDSLVEAVSKGDVKLNFDQVFKVEKASMNDAEFVLQEQTWRGPIQVRTGPSSRIYWLRLNVGRRELIAIKFYQSPIDNQQVAAELGVDHHLESMSLEGEIKPGHYLNPTKETPSTIRVIDRGRASVLAESTDFLKVMVEGKELKGLFQAQRNRGGDEFLWEPSQVAPTTRAAVKAEADQFEVSYEIPILKVDSEKREVTGIVLEPDVVDAQNDTITPEVIADAAHRFLARYNRDTQMGFMHRMFGGIGVELYESWLAKTDMQLGEEKVKAGSWLITIHVLSDQLWGRIKNGDITGFSIGGTASMV